MCLGLCLWQRQKKMFAVVLQFPWNVYTCCMGFFAICLNEFCYKSVLCELSRCWNVFLIICNNMSLIWCKSGKWFINCKGWKRICEMRIQIKIILSHVLQFDLYMCRWDWNMCTLAYSAFLLSCWIVVIVFLDWINKFVFQLMFYIYL